MAAGPFAGESGPSWTTPEKQVVFAVQFLRLGHLISALPSMAD